MNAEQQIADLQAQIETAKAKIAQLKAGMQEAKAEEMKQRVDNEEGNLIKELVPQSIFNEKMPDNVK